MQQPAKVFVFGLGYSASAALRLIGATPVGATTRSADKAQRLASLAPMHLFDGNSPDAGAAAALAAADHVLVSIAPDIDGRDPVLDCFGEGLTALAGQLRSIVYYSTVGVYGDHGGGWVDEASACLTVNARSLARLKAEAAWRAMADRIGAPLAILRLAGIYGPGRNGLVNLAEGTARRLIKPGQVFNRIHVEDIAGATARAFATGADGLFNISDDEPGPPQDVVAFAAGLMGVPVPPDQPFETADLSAMARSFYSENKRVANGRSRRDLGLAYRFPTYRDGLGALWASGTWRDPA